VLYISAGVVQVCRSAKVVHVYMMQEWYRSAGYSSSTGVQGYKCSSMVHSYRNNTGVHGCRSSTGVQGYMNSIGIQRLHE